MGDMVIVAYRPKPGREDELIELTREHVPTLRSLGLATDRPALTMQGNDGVVVEAFEWVSGGAERAHGDPDVQRLWARYGEVCDYVPLADLPEASEMFAHFRPLDL